MGNTSKLRGKAEIKSEIIAELYNSKEFRDTISKMHPSNLRDELRQEVVLILCEKEADEIISIYNSGGLKYYTVRIILNLIQSNTSPFYKKFRSGGFSDTETCEIEEAPQIDSIEDDLYKQLKECQALDEVDNLYWYDREIIKIYLRLGTYRAVEDETGIPWESIYKTIQKSCQKIKLKVA